MPRNLTQQCTACLALTEDLEAGICTDREACEARQPPLFGTGRQDVPTVSNQEHR